MLGMALVLFSGCRKSVAERAGESDANGYLCRQCDARFYTESGVFAERCPACSGLDIVPVIGFYCEIDGYTTLAARGADSVPCEKCGEKAAAIRLPHASEFAAWGAQKKSKAEVMQ